MSEEQQGWLAQAVEMARVKRYDDARELALRVLREDGNNPRALWIVASATNSLAERRNVLRTLVRVQPENQHARQILNTIEQELRSTASRSAAATQTLKPTPQPILLYALAFAALVIVAAAFAAAVL